eukprot:6129123-Ditylum_brightwellii.AAC.2
MGSVFLFALGTVAISPGSLTGSEPRQVELTLSAGGIRMGGSSLSVLKGVMLDCDFSSSSRVASLKVRGAKKLSGRKDDGSIRTMGVETVIARVSFNRGFFGVSGMASAGLDVEISVGSTY